jgi:hypothetical protein
VKAQELMTPTRMKRVVAGLVKREQVLEVQIQAVVEGYVNACFVYGPPGLGKTHLVTSRLDALVGKSWQHHTAYSTPKALMLAIAEKPNAIHVFEDCEKLYKTDVASSILRAACGSPRQKQRWVTYETAHETLRVNFTGGIIVVSNENLAKSRGPLSAVASRFRPIKWDLNIEERIARIISLAELGWARGEWVLTPAQCRTVARFLVEEMTQGHVDYAVDLRTFIEHALPAYAQHLAGHTVVDWRDVVRSKLRGEVSNQENRKERGSRLETIALGLALDKKLTTQERIAEWKKQTGLAQAIYYRHLKRAKSANVK